MTEAEWLACSDPDLLFNFLFIRNPGRVSDRKGRLFGAACLRQVWHLLSDARGQKAVEVAEQVADGCCDAETAHAVSLAAHYAAFEYKERPAIFDAMYGAGIVSSNFVPFKAADNVVNALVPLHGWASSGEWYAAVQKEKAKQARLARHILGNPFRPYPTPAFWPSAVVEMATVLYDGQGNRLILADALEEAGHRELADHFRAEEWHPKGCWAMDLILGKT